MESGYQQQLSEESAPSPEELKAMIEEKAKELFTVCDVEEKGFVNKLDMRRLVGEIPGHDESQLEFVFDSLDKDGNGFLTLEEFTQGFGGFLGINSVVEEPEDDPGMYEVDKLDQENDTIEKDFQQAMDSLGANGIFTRQDEIKGLWTKLRHENPELLGNFEDVIQKVSMDVRSATNSKGELEQVLRSRGTMHEEEVSKLYEEMEQQIQGEKEKLLSQEREREKREREEVDLEMKRKEELLHELLQKQTELEAKLAQLSVAEKQTKEEKERLEETNNKLYGKLEYTEKDLEQTKSYLKSLQDKVKEEKRARADASLRVTRGIAEERASLCKQLSLLRDMNKKLLDERDAVKHAVQHEQQACEEPVQRNKMIKQGSVMSDYFEPEDEHQNLVSDVNANNIPEEEEVEYDFAYEHSNGILPSQGSLADSRHPLAADSHPGTYDGNGRINGHMVRPGSINLMDESESNLLGYRSVDHRINDTPLSEELAQSLDMELEAAQENEDYEHDVSSPGFRHQWSMSTQTADSDLGIDEALRGPGEGEESPLEEDGQRAKGRKTKTEGEDTVDGDLQKTFLLKDPQRLYKVVFVGDSYVGKTSLMHRVCNDAFVESFNATIGVDFQVKTMTVNGHSVAIQLWDTAGQERFRSITRHYFRKADAVIVVYDISSEKSFLSVRNWMTSIEEVTDEHVVKVMVGNKLDLEDLRQVQTKSGQSLAEAFQSLFYEASAKSGLNVMECVIELAHKLLEKEDREMEEALKLINEVVAKKKCCRS